MIKTAVVLAGGLGTRFLPLTKSISKGILPLVDKPLIHYLLSEISESGIKRVVFVVSPRNEDIVRYLERGKGDEALDELLESLEIEIVFQEEPLGNGHALLQAEKEIGEDPFAMFYCDDLFLSRKPGIKQLLDVYKTAGKTLVLLSEVKKEEVVSYGVVDKEDLTGSLYKINNIVEKPSVDEAPSRLVSVGRFIFQPSIFKALKEIEPVGGETRLIDAINVLLEGGKTVYGVKVKGTWLRCGDKKGWIKSNMLLCMKDHRFGPELKEFLKDI